MPANKKTTLAQIIAMMNQKGGSGKTTTSQHTAITMAVTGKRVLIIDTDPQQSCFKFFVRNHAQFPNGYDGVIDVARGDVTVLQTLIAKHSKSYDYIFIDTAPALGKEMGTIISLSDMVMICCQPKFKDIEATESIVDSIRANQAIKPSIKAQVCITRVKSGTNITKHIDKLKALKLSVMSTTIRDYTCYEDADEQGVGVIHLDAANADKAAADMHNFTTELLTTL